jgi:hypothetical protein
MTEPQLMKSIDILWGKHIDRAVAKSPISAKFLAALIANESGGDPSLTRYELVFYARLKCKYSCWPEGKLKANSTSWGLTQILGINYAGNPGDLADPATNLITAVRMLQNFADRFHLDPARDFEDLFHCWNTGQPNLPTFDPKYASLGLARMALWRPEAPAETA